MKTALSCLLILICVSLVSAAAPKDRKPAALPLLNDAGHGSVSGQFTLDGDTPPRRILVRKGDPKAKDGRICAAADLPSDELVVDPKTQGIRHIFVYIRKVDKTTIHPKLKTSAQKNVVFDQKGCRFTPHTLMVRTDQSVLVKSGDNCAHNTHTYPIRNKADNFILNANNRIGLKFSYPIAEFLPTTIKCDIHPWMKAYWLILDHPYMAITDAQGRFTVTGLPPGTYEFRCWHELVGYVAAGSKRGFSVTIKANQTTRLPTVKVPVAKFIEETDE
jgi:plastocyanin